MTEKGEALSALEERLEYHFQNRDLLQHALIHPSYYSSQLDDAFPCQPPRWLGSGVWVSCLRENSVDTAALFRGRLGTVKPR